MEKSNKTTTMPFYTLERLSRVSRRASFFCNKTLPIDLFQKIESAVNDIDLLIKEFADYEKSQKD